MGVRSLSCHNTRRLWLPLSPLLTAILWTTSLWTTSAIAKITPFLPQGFMFDWTPDGQTPPIPTTAQCDTIHIKWSRGSEEGPNPTAPYYLQIYTSTFIVPFVIEAGSNLAFDWVVPFIPGTQYQICMFDSKGVSGGCQAVYTVYQAPGTTPDKPPTCFNLTYPRPETQLGVTGFVDNGPISQFGWIDQCTDLQVTPTNGTPPFTFTVAPALHPPYNITSPDMSPINWTVSLSWGAPFFVSLIDSTGMSWASGPLHSGGGGPTDCLALDSSEPKKSVSPKVAIGAGVGGLVFGLVAGALLVVAFTWWNQRRRPRRPERQRESTNGLVAGDSPARGHYRDLPSADSRDGFMRDQGYQIEPFVLPPAPEAEFGAHPRTASSPPALSPIAVSPTATGTFTQFLGTGTGTGSDGQSGSGSGSAGSRRAPSTTATIALQSPSPPRPVAERASSHVYVVHHDGGGAPISVYTDDGAEVVELPPRYPYSDRATAASSSSPLSAGPPTNRRTGPIPEKPSARRAVS